MTDPQPDPVAEAELDHRELLGVYGYRCRMQDLPDRMKERRYNAKEVGDTAVAVWAAANRYAAQRALATLEEAARQVGLSTRIHIGLKPMREALEKEVADATDRR